MTSKARDHMFLTMLLISQLRYISPAIVEIVLYVL
jgi:hypothetical protein